MIRAWSTLGLLSLGGCGCTVLTTATEYEASSIVVTGPGPVVAADRFDFASLKRSAVVTTLASDGETATLRLPDLAAVQLVAGASTVLAYGATTTGQGEAQVLAGVHPVGPRVETSTPTMAAAFDGNAYQLAWLDPLSGHLFVSAIAEDGTATAPTDLGAPDSHGAQVRLDMQSFDAHRVAIEVAAYDDSRAATNVSITFLADGAPVAGFPVTVSAPATAACRRSYVGSAVLEEPTTGLRWLRVFACVNDGVTEQLAFHLRPDHADPVIVPIQMFDELIAQSDSLLVGCRSRNGGPDLVDCFSVTGDYTFAHFSSPSTGYYCGPELRFCARWHWAWGNGSWFNAVRTDVTGSSAGVKVERFDGHGGHEMIGVVAIDENKYEPAECPD